LSEIEQSAAELLMILGVFRELCHTVTLTFDLLTLNFYSISHVMHLNSEQNLSETKWQYSMFWSAVFLGVGHNWQRVLRGAWTQLRQTWRGHKAVIVALHFWFSVRIYCCIFKRGRLKFEWCWKPFQISHFL